MKKVAVLFPAFLGGGAEAVCAWILESLKADFEVTLITLSDISLAELDKQYGTALHESGVKVQRVLISLPPIIRERIEKSLSMFSFRQFFLMRYYKNHLAGQFDLAISAFNEMDFGHPGVQYIHFPLFSGASDKVRSIVGYPDSAGRRVYKALLRYWARYSEARMRKNLTLVNSQWTSNLVKEIYGIDAKVVYPPAVLEFPDIPWEEREDGFVLISRVGPFKKIETAINIIASLRRKGYKVCLHVIGRCEDMEYKRKLENLAGHDDWLIFKGALDRKTYSYTLPRFKYGIHSWKYEPFGIGVAEMVLAGVIPFVPAEGGQVEIVNGDERLLWQTEQEAVSKIEVVLKNQELQERIQEDLSRHRYRWGPDRFKKEILEIVYNAIRGAR
jgi:glycosyltransferase involved in cell wall biosynthesis